MKHLICSLLILFSLHTHSQKVVTKLDYPKLSIAEELACKHKTKKFIDVNLDTLKVAIKKFGHVEFIPEESAISTWEYYGYNYKKLPDYKKDSLIMELRLFRMFTVFVEIAGSSERHGYLIFEFNYGLMLQAVSIHYEGETLKAIWNMPYRRTF